MRSSLEIASGVFSSKNNGSSRSLLREEKDGFCEQLKGMCFASGLPERAAKDFRIATESARAARVARGIQRLTTVRTRSSAIPLSE